ncbi:MAG: hypothetical protein KDB35_16840 [Acidimicrobiales bacterium]|nr:hypothetical protein [Acidimicrobiales bacterium]
MLVGTAALIAVGVAAVSLTQSRDGRSSSDVSPTTASGEPGAAAPSADPSTSATSGPSLPPLTTRPSPTTPVPPAADETGTWEVRFNDGGLVTVDGRGFDASIAPVEVALAPGVSALSFADDVPGGFAVEIGDAAGTERVALPAALEGEVLDLAGFDSSELVLVLSSDERPASGERPAPDDRGVDASGCFFLRALGVELCFSEPVP